MVYDREVRIRKHLETDYLNCKTFRQLGITTAKAFVSADGMELLIDTDQGIFDRDDALQNYLPTAAEIKKGCEEIRATWSVSEEKSRRFGPLGILERRAITKQVVSMREKTVIDTRNLPIDLLKD